MKQKSTGKNMCFLFTLNICIVYNLYEYNDKI